MEAGVAGHFGELLQGRLGPAGPVALVTLPCPVRGVKAAVRPGPFALRHAPFRGAPPLGPRAAAAFLRSLGLVPRGRFLLSGDLPPGGGAGASTAARLALARAAFRAAGRPLPPAEALAAACLASEGASDPLMFPEPARLLWASRQGVALARFPGLARLDVLGGFCGPPRRTDPRDMGFADVSDLVADWPAACRNAGALARIASLSAARNLALRHPGAEDPTAALAGRLGALGWAMAHTGSARALLFAPGTVPAGAGSALRAAGFAGITRFRPGEARQEHGT